MSVAFHRLHESGCFVIPNPWDIGSARLLQQLGFKALATTSSGFAWSMGRQDNHVTLEEALGHFRAIAGGVLSQHQSTDSLSRGRWNARARTRASQSV